MSHVSTRGFNDCTLTTVKYNTTMDVKKAEKESYKKTSSVTIYKNRRELTNVCLDFKMLYVCVVEENNFLSLELVNV
jgi:hypothetical protein